VANPDARPARGRNVRRSRGAVRAGWRGAVPGAPLLMLAVPPIADHPALVAGTSAFVLMLFAVESRRELGAELTASRMRSSICGRLSGAARGRPRGARPDCLNRP
jgi:hypothetical protein